MAAEDWIDVYDECDAEYWSNYEDPTGDDYVSPTPKKYTDKFTFNGRRIRTPFQRRIIRWRKKDGIKQL